MHLNMLGVSDHALQKGQRKRKEETEREKDTGREEKLGLKVNLTKDKQNI